MLWPIALVAVIACAQGRAVNISNTWVLPEEGFPVFYRYFRDRISWYEADAVCQFHHANLVTVDTTAQYDAVRAYLKELDISNAVWVGLIRSNPDGDFTWTDYRGLSGEGYWSAAPDARAAPLCAAADPSADYRWQARACGGPTVASFICELPVPQWALGAEGCMVRALPALTVLYLPESAAVQLTTDCGLDGIKRVLCTGNIKHDDLLKKLSCADESEENFTGTVLNGSSSSAAWTTPTEISYSEQETSRDIVTTDETVTDTTKTFIPIKPVGEANIVDKLNTTPVNTPDTKYNTEINTIGLGKDQKFETYNDNLQGNDIPKLVNENDLLLTDNTDELEDEQHMQHKILHEELARRGNFETIFNQPTDRFVPPLVMAKAKMSDDMTVLSLEEKHAQQIAEQHNLKYRNKILDNKSESQNSDSFKADTTVTTSTENHNVQETTTKSVQSTSEQSVTKIDINLLENSSDKNNFNQKINKPSSPKKYKGKAYEPKNKNNKQMEIMRKAYVKFSDNNSTQELNSTDKLVSYAVETDVNSANASDDDVSIDLKVIFKTPELKENDTKEKLNLVSMANDTKFDINSTNDQNKTIQIVESQQNSDEEKLETISDVQTHHIIQITIPSENTNATPAVFEVTTKMPPVASSTSNSNSNIDKSTSILSTNTPLKITTISNSTPEIVTIIRSETVTEDEHRKTSAEIMGTTMFPKEFVNDVTSTTPPASTEIPSTEAPRITYHDTVALGTTTENSISLTANLTNAREETSTMNNTNILSNDSVSGTLGAVNTELNSDLLTDVNLIETSTAEAFETTEGFQSPLLSGANDPIPKPNRSRRPQPSPNHNKFNPFRILG